MWDNRPSLLPPILHPVFAYPLTVENLYCTLISRVVHLLEIFWVLPLSFLNHSYSYTYQKLSSQINVLFTSFSNCILLNHTVKKIWISHYLCFWLQIKKNSTEIILNYKNLLFLVHLTEEFKGRSALGINLRLGLWFPFSAVLFVFSLSLFPLTDIYYSNKMLQ